MTQNLFDLTGRVALVVGGAGYLGVEVCRGLAHHGARVIVADLDATRAQQRAEAINAEGVAHTCTAAPVDVADEQAIADLLAGVDREHGRLDILVNATYVPHGAPMDALSADTFAASLRGNVAGAFVLARGARALMRGGGSILMFSSMYGRVSPDPRAYVPPMAPNPIEYGVAKAGLEQMVRYLAVRWAPDGIRVNAISPGPFPHLGLQRDDPAFIERLAQRVPMGRIGRAEEIAGAAVFLTSNAASYVTGHVLVVDGGWTVW